MNIEQMNAAKESMIDWLSHPNELGKPPAMIECAGTFDLHDMHYYIFKFKKRKLGAWLLGVCGGYVDDELENCGHVFSDMQEYYEKTAVIQATGMVEMIRSYWMNEAKKVEANQEAEKEKEQKKGSFLGFVLLSENKWDKQQLIADFKEMWDIDATEDEKGTDVREDSLGFSVGDTLVVVSMMPAPIPEHEAEECASNNYLWEDAVEVAKKHKAHLMVIVMDKNADPLETGKIFVKATACCCKQKTATGVYTSGTVFEPAFYMDAAEVMKQGELPVYNWIWFGLYQKQNRIYSYTYGLTAFGKDEIEILGAKAKPMDVLNFLYGMTCYVLSSDVTLHDGETIGVSKRDKHLITRSEGVALPGMTIKIAY